MTPKDRGLIKGALRRAFSRSQLHREVIQESIVRHSDPKRKRVKTWCRCNVCKKPDAISNMAVDHISPLIPVTTSFADMSLDEVVGRLWCEKRNLQAICTACHDHKCRAERAERKLHKSKGKK